jgi:Glyoxalase-like domain
MAATPIQITIDCADPALQSRFWAAALHYEEMSPPDGSATWVDYWRARGMSEEELVEIGEGYDKIGDPAGGGPPIWFQPVPEGKVVKNRVHLDLNLTGRTQPLDERKTLVDNEINRLEALGAQGARVHTIEGMDYYAVTLQDPEGNEFCVS